MTRYSITLERNGLGHMPTTRIGTDALNAIASIPGTDDIQIESESESQVEISYV